MKRWLVTFSGAGYEETTSRTVELGPKLGAHEVFVYDDAWILGTDFYRMNRWLWEHPHKRGFGWYAWKPFIILDALSKIDPDGVVFYLDGDSWPVADLSRVFEVAARDGAMLFAACGQRNRQWCKRDCLVVMGQDEARFIDAPAGCARFMAFRKGDWKAEQLLAEWLAYCVNPLATTFDPSRLAPEHEGFIEHRTEQAILTLLALKHGFKLWREADQDGEGWPEDRDVYGQLTQQRHMGGVPHPTTGTPLRRIP